MRFSAGTQLLENTVKLPLCHILIRIGVPGQLWGGVDRVGNRESEPGNYVAGNRARLKRILPPSLKIFQGDGIFRRLTREKVIVIPFAHFLVTNPPARESRKGSLDFLVEQHNRSELKICGRVCRTAYIVVQLPRANIAV